VSTGHKVTKAVSSRYAGALVALAQEQGQLDPVSRDVSALAALIAQSPEFRYFITLPTLSRAQQTKALQSVVDKLGLSTIVKNFMGVLIDNSRLGALGDVLSETQHVIDRLSNITNVQVQSAHGLDDATRAEISKTLKAALGGDVHLETRVTPEILGGVVITVGSRRIDHSVRRKLQSLQQSMKACAAKNFGST
jgi:F-type H+-transporting ATPase subunit delta